MKKLVLVILMMVSAGQAQVLGEFSGEAQWHEQSSHSSFDRACKVAFNYFSSSEVVSLEYSVFECGGWAWNDPSFYFKAIDGKLYRQLSDGSFSLSPNGTQNPDGSVEFTIERTVTKKVHDYIVYPGECSNGYLKSRTFSLENTISYKIEPQIDGSYSFTRLTSVDNLIKEIQSESPFCTVPRGYFYRKENSKGTISGHFKKK